MAAIDLGGEEAENLADRVLSYRDELTVLGTAIAAAFRLTGKKKLERHLGIAIGYIDAIDNFSGGMLGEGLPSYAHYNFAEATLAFARLHPEDAKIRLRDLIAKPRSSPAVALDIAGGALAGLLPLFPDDVLILDWAERILGNRVRSERVFGALRGIAEGRISQAKQWVRYHLYAGCSSNHIGEHPAIMRAASEALIALGEAAPPPFDETDEFARRVPAEMLPEALLDTGKYHGDAVFKRILKEKIFSPRLLEIGGEVLRDRFRVSGDETGTGALLGNDTRKEGIKTMVALGATALPVLDSLLALPRMAGRDKTTILYAMGIATDASALWKMLANASREEIFSLLDRRPAEWVGRIDLAAAWAFARYGAEARSAIESCLRWRVDLLGECETDSWADEEPQVARLPLLFSHFDGADDPLKELLEKIKSYQAREVWDRVLKRKLVKLAEIPQGTQQLILKDAPRGDSSTRYTCAICIAESVVDVTYKGEDIHLNSVLDYQQNQYEQRSTIPCASPQNATALAECMARSLCSLGFTLLPTGRS